MAKFQIYKDAAGEYRWRLRADNNEIIADSAEGYNYKTACQDGINLIKNIAPKADTEDLTQP